MMTKHEYPIMEFDDEKIAKINPSTFAWTTFETDKLIITFFPEIMERLKDEEKIAPYLTIGGENPVYIYKFVDADVLITLGYVGCPACGGNLDLFQEMGAKKVMFCGGGGVLDKNIEVGQLLLVDGAIRDEGFSYHYLEPSRCVYANKEVNDKVAKYLEEHEVPYMRGLAWTTDAIFRETPDRIERRKAEGAKIVEMEQAGNLAVAQCRGFSYAALIYGGDDVSQKEWNSRNWNSRDGIRYNLVMLCKELVEVL